MLAGLPLACRPRSTASTWLADWSGALRSGVLLSGCGVLMPRSRGPCQT
jgi:hypothetical protein